MMYLWDASNHDWSRGPMNLVKAKAEGISGFTHKAAEGIPGGNGYYFDPWFPEAMRRAKAAAFPVIGAYYVNWPGDQISQADHFVALVQKYAPWWRDVCFLFQLDAEKFSYMPRAPTMGENNQFCARVQARTGCPAHMKCIPNYAPAWLYGGGVATMNVPNWWQSAYGNNPFGQFNRVGPSNNDARWAPINGKTPAILQYASQTTIAGQRPADANAVRVNTVAELQALFGGIGDDMPTPQEYAKAVWDYSFATDDLPHNPHQASDWVGNAARATNAIKLATDTLEPGMKALKETADAIPQKVVGLLQPLIGTTLTQEQVDQIAAKLAELVPTSFTVNLSGSAEPKPPSA